LGLSNGITRIEHLAIWNSIVKCPGFNSACIGSGRTKCGPSRVDELWLGRVNVFSDAGGWSVSGSDVDPSNVTSCASAVGEMTIIGTIIAGPVGSTDNEVCVSWISNVSMINSMIHGSDFGGNIKILQL
jgi:hypothetical protein